MRKPSASTWCSAKAAPGASAMSRSPISAMACPPLIAAWPSRRCQLEGIRAATDRIRSDHPSGETEWLGNQNGWGTRMAGEPEWLGNQNVWGTRMAGEPEWLGNQNGEGTRK